MRRALSAACLAATTTLGPAVSSAQELATETTHGSAPAPAQELATETKPEDTFEVSGRLFVRESYSTLEILGDRVHRHERVVDSARVQLDYRRKDYLRAVVEVDFDGGDADLKDGYIRLEPGAGLRLQAGRFKQPMSVIALDSKWDLPATERGLLATLEVDGEDLPFSGGRGVGVSSRYRAPGDWKPTVTAALFQHPLGRPRGGLDASEELAQDAYLRLEIEPIEGLELATSLALLGYLARPGELDSFAHAPIVSLESYLEFEAIQVWAEAYLGDSLFAEGAPFWAARTIASPGFERRCWPKRIEPFASASIFDPDVGSSGDRNSELGGGVNLAFTKYLRLTADVFRRFAEGPAAPAIAGTDVRLQLGARFSR